MSPAGLQKSFADHMGTSAARLLHQEGDRDVCIKARHESDTRFAPVLEGKCHIVLHCSSFFIQNRCLE